MNCISYSTCRFHRDVSNMSVVCPNFDYFISLFYVVKSAMRVYFKTVCRLIVKIRAPRNTFKCVNQPNTMCVFKCKNRLVLAPEGVVGYTTCLIDGLTTGSPVNRVCCTFRALCYSCSRYSWTISGAKMSKFKYPQPHGVHGLPCRHFKPVWDTETLWIQKFGMLKKFP